MFTKGQPGGPGRPKGSENKVSKTLKEAILEAFGELGGPAWLIRTAKDQPAAFMTLIGKVLPMTIEGKTDSTVTIVVETGVRRAGDE
jgi:hypothetical protein